MAIIHTVYTRTSIWETYKYKKSVYVNPFYGIMENRKKGAYREWRKEEGSR